MDFSINAKKREGGDGAKLRADGQIPAVVYGPEIDPISVSVDYREFEKLHTAAGESSLIDCVIAGQKEPIIVLIQDLQHDPVKGQILHVDFRQIKMGEEMSAMVELHFVGEPDAVKSLGGTLNKSYDAVNVKCLPKDLVSNIEVDLTKLATFEDSIHIKDLVLPDGITVTDEPEAMVAKVAPPLTEEQLAAMEEEDTKGVEDVVVDGEKVVEGESDTASEEDVPDKEDSGDKKRDDEKKDDGKGDKKE
jgi:large subunit ribosomal protein L25